MTNQPLILVINLDSRKDRLMKMKERLCGYKFVRIPASTVEELDSKFVSTEHSITLAEMACKKSHIAALKKFLNSNHDLCIILEDDIILGNYFFKFITDFKSLPRDSFVVKLETHYNKFRFSIFNFKINGFRFIRLYEYHFGAGAYAVSRKGASLIISELEKHDIPVDDVIFEQMVFSKKFGKALQLNPACCIQEKHICEALKEDSDIQAEREVRFENRQKLFSQRKIDDQKNLNPRKRNKKVMREVFRIVTQIKCFITLRFKRRIRFQI